ncbi:MAG: hypothetical protein Q7U54_11870 [Bacteroidales bacterium]|nr:hypothetical protein [Bacteroidales bacterium]
MIEEEQSLTPYEVFEGSAWEAGLLKSILEDNDVENYMTEAYSLPWNNLPVKGAAAKLFVALKDVAKAKAIIEEFNSNMAKENSDEPTS